MAESIKSDRDKPPATAEELRMSIPKRQLGEAERADRARRKGTDFVADFLGEGVTEHEIAMVHRRVVNALHSGKFEALVYCFPAALCIDGGQAINNADRDWPQTLQGKPKEFYDRYQAFGKPAGYRLKVQTINFQDGIPSEIGFLLDWDPRKI
ncbi:histidine kinase [Mesorhizobium sp. B2-4-14]|uniref:histidine kinase n=1 Tax=Mesorhizobium sp. B2-4-14 TaxID=2589935 RepID=UPI0011271D4A|nr:histidine kinase [Mesorhizobium sp. B2-4-14]TPK93633.1 histidine kinase [Mesorhizobium sp. B2-4-14]